MAYERYEYAPDYAVHPGEMLAELIDVYHLEQGDLALRLGMSPKHLSNIVNEKAGMTARTAVALERVFPDRRAGYWLSLQEAYDMFHARKETDLSVCESAAVEEWMSLFDYDWLRSQGYVSSAKACARPGENAIYLLEFFGCATLSAWHNVYGATLAALESAGLPVKGEVGNALAWLRQGQRKAALRFAKLPPFSRRTFARSLRSMRKMHGLSGSAAFSAAEETCRTSGVLLVEEPYVFDVPNSANVQGALFWSRQTPCIQVNSALAACDEFWLGFAREADRVLESGFREAIIDLQGNVLEWLSCDDAYAWLLPRERRRAFLQEGDFSKEAIRRFARETGTDAGMVVGWLQKRGRVPASSPLNALKSRIEYAVIRLPE